MTAVDTTSTLSAADLEALDLEALNEAPVPIKPGRDQRTPRSHSRLSVVADPTRAPRVSRTPEGVEDPTAHLSDEQVEELGRELDALRDEVLRERGESDAAYIRRVITVQRSLELASRGVLLFSGFPAAWVIGTTGLSIAKILENMEIGHNVMHGQWDWMRDPKIHSTRWEWDNATPSDLWKHSHNELHHTWTNVIGKDNDLGYGIMRVDEAQRWVPMHLGQPIWNAANMLIFEYGIASYDLELGAYLKGRKDKAVFKRDSAKVINKIRRQATRDYVVHPLLSGPNVLPTLAANVTANIVRNIWTHSVIMCGHFPEGVATFAKRSIDGETRGEWYLRQMLGSANISGSRAMHIMTGNLSHQIEHHLFPDLPSNRYIQIAPRVREISDRYGLAYTSGSLPRQVFSAWRTVVRLSLPNETSLRQTVGILAKGGMKGLKRRARATSRSAAPAKV
ncbi:fatty acid desaturase family protein [Janibacter sp. G1551]|uniref:fatty acid desaturase family protein n=1 Tax=Janibacter sp. G1551 TaxID=3420440 RepID=UPI003D03F863